MKRPVKSADVSDSTAFVGGAEPTDNVFAQKQERLTPGPVIAWSVSPLPFLIALHLLVMLFFSSRWSRRSLPWLMGATAAVVVTGGVALQSAPAQAQTVTNEEITNYAEAVLTMDADRQAAYRQISDIMVSAQLEVADYALTCPNAQTLTDVPNSVRPRVKSILIEYCNSASTIVEESGLTVRRFNAITEAHRSDAELAQRIRDEILLLQQ